MGTERPRPPAPSSVTAGSGPSASPKPLHGPPIPPPLPISPHRNLRTAAVGMGDWKTRALSLMRGPNGRYVKLGAALFGAGVLVGVVGAAVVLGGDDDQAVEVAALASATSAAPKAVTPAPSAVPAPPAPPPKPAATGPMPLAKAREVAERKAASGLVQVTDLPVSDPTQLPISSFAAPTCRQLLGKSITERRDPKRANVQTALANRALVRGNVREAHAAYCLAWAWDRSNADRRLNLATLYVVRRDWAKAAELAQSALELEPDNRRALSVVSDAWAALNKTEKAREALLAAERKPAVTERDLALMVKRDLALAKSVARKGDVSLAERLYRRVLLVAPDHAGATRGVAGCLLKLGDPRAAEAWARKAQSLERGQPS